MSWASVILLVSIPWQWLPSFDIGPLERQTARPPAREEHAPPRTTMDQPPAVPRMAQLSDELVLRALDAGRAAFVGCWKRALAADPLMDATKIKLRIELDGAGSVVAVTHDAPNERLGNCLTAVARGMKFPASTTPAFAEFPLFFRPE